MEMTLQGTNRLSDTETFRNAIEVMSKIVDEAEFNITKEGIKVLMPDRTMVCVVSLNILPAMFEDYNITEDAKCSLNLGHLLEVLKRCSKDDILKFSWNKSDFMVTICGAMKRTFKLPALEGTYNTERPPIDELTFDAHFGMHTKNLVEATKDARLIGDSIRITAEPDKVVFSAKGDVRDMEIPIGIADRAMLKLECTEKQSALYPLEYLEKILSVKKMETANIHFKTDYPMKIDFTVLDKMTLGFILAPRVSEE